MTYSCSFPGRQYYSCPGSSLCYYCYLLKQKTNKHAKNLEPGNTFFCTVSHLQWAESTFSLATWPGVTHFIFRVEDKWRVVTARRRPNRRPTPLVLTGLVGSGRRGGALPATNNSVFEALLTLCVGLSWSCAPSLAPVASIFIQGNVGTTATSCSPPRSKVDSSSVFSFSYFLFCFVYGDLFFFF